MKSENHKSHLMPTTFLKSTESVRIMYVWKLKLGFEEQCSLIKALVCQYK